MALSDSLDELEQNSNDLAASNGLENRTAELEGGLDQLEQKSRNGGEVPSAPEPLPDIDATAVANAAAQSATEAVAQAADQATPPPMTWDQIKADPRFEPLGSHDKLTMLKDYAEHAGRYLKVAKSDVDPQAIDNHMNDFVTREQNALFPEKRTNNAAQRYMFDVSDSAMSALQGITEGVGYGAIGKTSNERLAGLDEKIAKLESGADQPRRVVGMNRADSGMEGAPSELDSLKKDRAALAQSIADGKEKDSDQDIADKRDVFIKPAVAEMTDFRHYLTGFYKINPKADKTLSDKVAGALASVSDMALGGKVMIAKMMAAGYENAYSSALQENGGDERKAHQAALNTTVESIPHLLAYTAGGKIAGAAEKLLPKTASSLTRGLVGGTASAGANMATSAALRVSEGQPVLGDVQSNLTDAIFGAVHGYDTFQHAKEKARAARIQEAHDAWVAEQSKANEYEQTNLPMSAQATREAANQDLHSKIANLDQQVASTSTEGDEKPDAFTPIESHPNDEQTSSGPRQSTADESTVAGADAPAADAGEGTPPANSPEVVNAQRLAKLPLADFTREITDHPKQLTGYAYEVGKQLATPEGVQELTRLMNEAGEKVNAAKEKRDIDTFAGEAFRRQFFREASEAARAAQGEEGLSATPENINAEQPQPKEQHEQTSKDGQGDNLTEASTVSEEPSQKGQVTDDVPTVAQEEKPAATADVHGAKRGEDVVVKSPHLAEPYDGVYKGTRNGEAVIDRNGIEVTVPHDWVSKAEEPNKSSEAATESSATTEPTTPAKGSREEIGDRPATSTTPKSQDEKRTGLVEKKKAEKAPSAIRGETQNHEQATVSMLNEIVKPASPEAADQLKEQVGKSYALVQKWLNQFKLTNENTQLRVDVKAKKAAGVEDPRTTPLDLLRDDLVKNQQETGDPFKTKTKSGEIKDYSVQQRMYSKLIDYVERLENKTKAEFERGTEEGDNISVLDDDSKHDKTSSLMPSQPERPDHALEREESREPVEGESPMMAALREAQVKHLEAFTRSEDLPLDAAPKATKEQITRATRLVLEELLNRGRDEDDQIVDGDVAKSGRKGPAEKLRVDPDFRQAVEDRVLGGIREDLRPQLEKLREKNQRASALEEALFTPRELAARREELRKQYQPAKGINNVMERIAATAGSSPEGRTQKLLAQVLAKVGRNAKVNFSNVFAQKRSAAGDYNPRTTDIRVSSSLSDNSFRWVAIHEKIHAVLHDKVEAFLQGEHHLLTPEDLGALHELESLRKAALQHDSVPEAVRESASKLTYGEKLEHFQEALKKDANLTDHYGLMDLHEFTTEALTNKSFQEVLNNMKLSDLPVGSVLRGEANTGSVWSRIKALFRQVLFGENAVDENSYLAKAFDRSLDVVKTGALEDQVIRQSIKTEPDAFRQDMEQQAEFLKDTAAENGYGSVTDFALEQPELFQEATEAYRNGVSEGAQEPVMLSFMPKEEKVQDETSKRAGDLYKKIDAIKGFTGKSEEVVRDAMKDGASTADAFADAFSKAGLKPNVAKAAGEVIEAHFKLAAIDKAAEAEKTAAAQAQERDTKPAQVEENAEPFGTSIKNAVTDQERIKRGLEPADPVARKGFGEVWDKVLDKLKTNEAYQHELIAELKKKPRAVTDEEDATLLHRQITLQNDYARLSDEVNKAADAGDVVAKIEAETRLSVKLDELHDLYDINRRVGTETGRGLNARKMLANDTYGLTNNDPTRMLNDKRAVNGGEALSPEVRKQVEDLHKKMFKLSQDLLDAETRAADATREARVTEQVKNFTEEGKKSKSKKDPAELDKKRNNLLDGMRKDVEKNGLDNIDSWIKKLAKEAIERGVTQPRHVVDYVHAYVSKIAPDMTRRDTMDAISGYGRWTQLSKDETEVKLRDVKGQLREAGKLEDMLGLHKAPQKTGKERATPSDKERQLKKLVAEAKKKGNYDDSGDPATRLKSALDAVKTRLKNQIKDLTNRFETGEKRPERTGIEYDAEADRMLALRDQMQATLDEIEGGKPGFSDEERAKIAKKSLEKQIAEYDRRLKDDDFSLKEKKPTISTPEIEALRARRDALREEYKWLDEVLNPERYESKPISPEAALRAFKSRTLSQIADYRERLAAKDFAPRVKKSALVKDVEATKLRGELDLLKAKWDLGLRQDRMARRSNPEKALDFLAKYSRAAKLTAGTTLFKLQSAGVLRQVATNVENLTTSGLRLIPGMKTIADLAPSEGAGFKASKEYQALASSLTQGMVDAVETFKNGKSALDLEHAKRLELDGGALEFFGRLHGMLKAPVKRAAYERSLANRIEFADRNGIDITDDGVLTRLKSEAYKDGQRAIFMNDNAVVDAYKRMLSRFQQRNKETGEVSFGHKAVETAAKVIFPIVKIPTNYAAESLVHVFGLATGPSKILSAGLKGVRSRADGESIAAGFKEGVSKLTPDEADMVMRHIKKGSLGAATMLLGFLNPSFVQAGGYYQKGEKRKDGELGPGELKIGPIKVPNYLAHAPLLEALQLGATLRRVSESKVKGVAKGLSAGAQAALFGLIEEVPFAHEIGELNKVMEGRAAEYLAGVAKGIVIPAAIQNAATLADQKRDTHWWEMKARPVETHGDWAGATIGKTIESGIPGLRNTMPDKKKH